VQDQTRARNRLTKFLRPHGIRRPARMTRWKGKHRVWLSSLRFDYQAMEHTFADLLGEVVHMAERIKRLEDSIDQAIGQSPQWIQEVITGLQELRGVGKVSSVTLIAELGSFLRFLHPSELMGYTGLIPREHSSGRRIRQGRITKTGNAHLRRVLVEAAWSIRRKPGKRPPLRPRQQGVDPQVVEKAVKAQHRLHKRYWQLMGKGKDSRTAAVAVARELIGFVWDIGTHIERRHLVA